MAYRKKICNDILHLALILTFMRLEPLMVRENSLHHVLEVGDLSAVSTIAYRGLPFHDVPYFASSHYRSLKNIFDVDDTMFLDDRLSNFSSRQNVIAYFSDEPATQNAGEHEDVNTSSTRLESNSSSVAVGTISENSSSSQDLENLFSPSNIDLSPEDMDLIEILWKQDIDLGVSREAYNSLETQDTEKLKSGGLEFADNIKDLGAEETNPKFNDDSEEITLYHELESLSYIIDSETGEHITQDRKATNDAVNHRVDESIFDGVLFKLEECRNLTFDHLKNRDVDCGNETSTRSQILASHICEPEDTAKCERQSPDQNRTDQETRSGMCPSMDEYWQDISSTLPFSLTSSNVYNNCLPRLNRTYPEDDGQIVASTSVELTQQSPASDIFAGALYQNASLSQHLQDGNNSFCYVNSTALGITSLGCAVASSIATLTNDADPVPDVCANMSNTSEMDRMNVLYPNNASDVPTNESMISEMLFGEELQMIPIETVVEPVSIGLRTRLANEQFDSSSESINSSTSRVRSSLSDNNADNRIECEGTASVGHDRKRFCCSRSACSFDQSSTSIPYCCPDGLFHNSSVHTNASSRSDYTHHSQHNHSYHLPFFNLSKPVPRSKTAHSARSDDEDNSRDEKRAKALKLPITIYEIINLAIDEFNERLSKFELTEPQLTLIRDIRRRGKNKVAAQNCRKRKMEQISGLQQDLDFLQAERWQLKSERRELLHQRQSIQEKYSELCQLIQQSTSNTACDLDIFSSSKNVTNHESTPNVTKHETDNESIFQGVRAKKKN